MFASADARRHDEHSLCCRRWSGSRLSARRRPQRRSTDSITRSSRSRTRRVARPCVRECAWRVVGAAVKIRAAFARHVPQRRSADAAVGAALQTTPRQVHTLPRTLTRASACTHMRTGTHTRARLAAHIHAVRTHAITRAAAHTARAYVRMHTHPRAYGCTHAPAESLNARSSARMHRTYMCTCTHAHAHSCVRALARVRHALAAQVWRACARRARRGRAVGPRVGEPPVLARRPIRAQLGVGVHHDGAL